MKKTAAVLCICVLLFFALCGSVSADEPYDTYTYSYYNEPKLSPHAYLTEAVVTLKDAPCGPLNEPTALVTDQEENLYIADTGNNRIVILDKDFQYKGELGAFGEDHLNGPCGVYVTPDGEIYVGDTENQRIVVFGQDYQVKRIFSQPESSLLPEGFTYKPYALCVDDAGRMYVIAKSTNMGVIELTADGTFSGFLGAKKVTPSLSDIFWRFFMNDEQKSRSQKVVPTEYNNITIDEDGFLYVTTNAISQYDQYAAIQARGKDSANLPIVKLNPMGIDVLSRNGFYPPAGDTKFTLGTNTDGDYGPSQIIGIALADYGIYSVLDNKRGKIFTYDNDGNLLYAFGVKGLQEGSFENLTSIAYKGDRLLALDKKAGSVTVFSPTAYQKTIHAAIASFEENDYDRSMELWSELAETNSNLDMAYIGLGKIHMHQKNYREAMKYFKIANNKDRYSQAFSSYRKEIIEKFALLVPVVLFGAIFLLAKLFKRIRRANRNPSSPDKAWKRFGKHLVYAFHVMVHPFDGFWDLKHEKRGSLPAAVCINVLACVCYCFYTISGGYVYKDFDIHSFNLLFTFSYVFLFVLLWSVANGALTSLVDGEGSFRDIYVTVSYSLLPLILLLVPATILSNFITQGEIYLVNFLVGIALGWTILLVFFGMMVIHNYSLGKNILSSVLTVAGMLILLFLAILFVDLIQRIVSYFANVLIEVTFRF